MPYSWWQVLLKVLGALVFTLENCNMSYYMWLVILLVLGTLVLVVCSWPVTRASRTAKSQLGTSNNGTRHSEAYTYNDDGCNNLRLVTYCSWKRRATFHINTSEEYSFLEAQFEANGDLIDNTTCDCYSSTAERVTVYLDGVCKGDNFSFLLSWQYPRCNKEYSGSYKNGELHMEGGIMVEKDQDEGCSHEDKPVEDGGTNSWSLSSHWWTAVMALICSAYLRL